MGRSSAQSGTLFFADGRFSQGMATFEDESTSAAFVSGVWTLEDGKITYTATVSSWPQLPAPVTDEIVDISDKELIYLYRGERRVKQRIGSPTAEQGSLIGKCSFK
jgi:hypothetical protein